MATFFLPDIYNCFVILFVLLSWLEPKVNENGDGYNPFLFFYFKENTPSVTGCLGSCPLSQVPQELESQDQNG